MSLKETQCRSERRSVAQRGAVSLRYAKVFALAKKTADSFVFLFLVLFEEERQIRQHRILFSPSSSCALCAVAGSRSTEKGTFVA